MLGLETSYYCRLVGPKSFLLIEYRVKSLWLVSCCLCRLEVLAHPAYQAAQIRRDVLVEVLSENH